MARQTTRRVTLEDVAAAAQVSRATVSRVVNGSFAVDAATALRVESAIAKLNYVPNQAARTLMTHRTNTVTLVAAETEDRVFGDPFFASIIRGVSQGLAGSGWWMTIVMAHDDAQVADAARYLAGGHTDGVLFVSEHGSHDLARSLSNIGVPVVIGGRPMDPSLRASYVDQDNLGGAQLAAQHLARSGRSRIATITGPQDMTAGVDRLVGFQRGLGAAFDPALVEIGDFTSESGAAAMEALLEREPDIDGVFAASDLMAIGALQALSRAGRRVPDDVAVMGFDDFPLASQSSPPLSTVRQDTVEQGRRMAELLLRRITQKPASDASAPDYEGVILPVSVVLRASS
ncbi:LacI family DNA-binding transcriptional regulator [Microbacterium sp. SLBN-146]|uniref:LacI family DNA-binding transcriptional regulator n=1 Tax=Microbacterium sp. SLBN-146 TaxID=2768457 RepID=UPI001154F20E|nr:LacI family DNA-binding transcriptional regulator [Microbacterium sp. SLBN-146]TQJ31109.1 LacI family transcriptional regulator [Microbacterium sp. SLBN-146]